MPKTVAEYVVIFTLEGKEHRAESDPGDTLETVREWARDMATRFPTTYLVCGPKVDGARSVLDIIKPTQE